MSKRIVAQVARVIAVIGALALCGCTSNATWSASHYLSSGDQFVPIVPDGLLRLADTEAPDPQAP
jgi:outer membrane lipoprotein SlyB